MEISSAAAAVAANIAPTAKQIILLALISIPFLSAAVRGNFFDPLAEAESAHRSRIGMRPSFHKIIFNVPAEFLAKHVTSV